VNKNRFYRERASVHGRRFAVSGDIVATVEELYYGIVVSFYVARVARAYGAK